MKITQWTLGLAAVGLVSLAPGLRAQDTNTPASTNAPVASTNAPTPAPIPLATALTATTISGYVDTSMVWVPGTGNAHPVITSPTSAGPGSHADSFALDSADVKIARAPDSSKWAAGYTLEAQYGPDAINPFAGSPLRQAYVELMVPVGNGLDLEVGQWDNILGYESNDDYKNPNWSRSYGYDLEPVTHTGILGTYKFCDAFSAQFGVADTLTGPGNATANNYTGPESKKAIVSLFTFTAPTNWGSIAGSTLTAGFDDGPGSLTSDRQHLYLGASLNTPVKGLTFGAAYDSVWSADTGGPAPVTLGYASALGGYASYALTDKATLNGRVEYAHGALFAPGAANEVAEFTATFQYQLWDNVTSRLEARWDHSGNVNTFGSVPGVAGPTERNQVLFAANLIYKF
jgi:hypothetical protein